MRGKKKGPGGLRGACAAPCLPRSFLQPGIEEELSAFGRSRVRPAGAALGPADRSVLCGRQVAPAPSIRSPAAELRTPQTIPSAAATAAKLNNPPRFYQTPLPRPLFF